jgi:osmotically inducible lipoprotein OsmB
MKKFIMIFCFVGSMSMLTSCTNQEVGTTTGAVAGAGIGYAVGGNALGTMVGAGAGALIGNQLSR